MLEGVTLKETTKGGKKTLGLYFTAKAFSRISPLFESETDTDKTNFLRGIHPCTKMGIKGYAWSLHALRYTVSGDKKENKYVIYGECGDSTFGPSPTWHSTKYAGNIRAARIGYGKFLEYIEQNEFKIIGSKFGI